MVHILRKKRPGNKDEENAVETQMPVVES